MLDRTRADEFMPAIVKRPPARTSENRLEGRRAGDEVRRNMRLVPTGGIAAFGPGEVDELSRRALRIVAGTQDDNRGAEMDRAGGALIIKAKNPGGFTEILGHATPRVEASRTACAEIPNDRFDEARD
jgi:hypothetical protein